MKSFSDRLKYLRGGSTLADFSRKLGMSLKTYEHYEAGRRKPNIKFVLQIVEVCGVSADWLLGLSASAPVFKAPEPAPFFNVKGLHAAEAPPGCPNCARLNATVDTLLERLKEHAVEAGRSRPARKKHSSEPVKSSLYPA